MSSEDLKKPSGLRKRILGAIILVALIVIFFPLLLEHVPQNIYVNELAKEPQAPPIKSIALGDFTNPPAVANLNQPVQAWSLQLSDFAQEASANQLAQQLQKQGYPAYVRAFMENKTTHYHLLVGPETDSKKLQAWIKALSQKNLSGTLIPYTSQEL